MADDKSKALRAQYVSSVRKLHRHKQSAALIGCVVGVLLMMSSNYITGAPSWLRFAGLAVVAASWMTFIYVLVSRTRYVRANPFQGGN
jgi:uncharacterized membrane protein